MKRAIFLLSMIFSVQAFADIQVQIEKANTVNNMENKDFATVNLDQKTVKVTQQKYENKFVVTGNNVNLIENQAGGKVNVNTANIEGHGECIEAKEYWLCP